MDKFVLIYCTIFFDELQEKCKINSMIIDFLCENVLMEQFDSEIERTPIFVYIPPFLFFTIFLLSQHLYDYSFSSNCSLKNSEGRVVFFFPFLVFKMSG